MDPEIRVEAEGKNMKFPKLGLGKLFTSIPPRETLNWNRYGGPRISSIPQRGASPEMQAKWKTLPTSKKTSLLRTLRDSDGDGVPDKFEEPKKPDDEARAHYMSKAIEQGSDEEVEEIVDSLEKQGTFKKKD